MKIILLSALLLVCALGARASAAGSFETFDFPGAILKIRTGKFTELENLRTSGREIKMDGHVARSGELTSSGTTITWTVAPALEIGDEYVVVIRRPGKKPQTFSGVFKGGLLVLTDQADFTVEVEN